MSQAAVPETVEKPPFDLRIIVFPWGAWSADVVARIKAEPGSVPEFVMVGQAHRVSHDEEPGEWKAWLWPKGGFYPAMDTSTEAMTRPSCGDLETLLNKRLKSQGAWWS